MKIELIVSGTPAGQDFWGGDDYAFKSLESLYTKSDADQLMRVQIVNRSSEVWAYYSFVVYNVRDHTNRPGGYLSLTIRMNDYYFTDVQYMYTLLRTVYRAWATEEILISDNDRKFKISSFSEIAADLHKLDESVCVLFSSLTKDNLVHPLPQRVNSASRKIELSFDDSSPENVWSYVKGGDTVVDVCSEIDSSILKRERASLATERRRADSLEKEVGSLKLENDRLSGQLHNSGRKQLDALQKELQDAREEIARLENERENVRLNQVAQGGAKPRSAGKSSISSLKSMLPAVTVLNLLFSIIILVAMPKCSGSVEETSTPMTDNQEAATKTSNEDGYAYENSNPGISIGDENPDRESDMEPIHDPTEWEQKISVEDYSGKEPLKVGKEYKLTIHSDLPQGTLYAEGVELNPEERKFTVKKAGEVELRFEYTAGDGRNHVLSRRLEAK